MPNINNNWAIAELLGQVMEKPKKIKKIKFSELGLPGVEIVGAPRRSLLHTVRGSQLPYNAESQKSAIKLFNYFELFDRPIFPY